MRIHASGSQIIELIRKAQKVLVLLSPQPTADAVAAALSLGRVAENLGRKADTVCLGQLPSQTSTLDKVNEIKNRLDPVNLIVSFNWAQSLIEKVSYSVEGDKFNLIITPSGKKLDPTQVEYSYRGSSYDLVISVGVSSAQEQPNNLFDKSIFETTPTVNIDRQVTNANYGKVNVVDPDSDSLSGLICEILKSASQSNFDQKIADYLLFGLRAATNNFDFVKNPATFEQAAFLTKVKNQSLGISYPENEVSGEKNLAPQEAGDWFSPKVIRSSKVS